MIANMYKSWHCKIHLVNNTKTTLSKLVMGMKVFGSHPKNIIWIQCRLHLLSCKLYKEMELAQLIVPICHMFSQFKSTCVHLNFEIIQIAIQNLLWFQVCKYIHSKISLTLYSSSPRHVQMQDLRSTIKGTFLNILQSYCICVIFPKYDHQNNSTKSCKDGKCWGRYNQNQLVYFFIIIYYKTTLELNLAFLYN
jgi:hypothetical protein